MHEALPRGLIWRQPLLNFYGVGRIVCHMRLNTRTIHGTPAAYRKLGEWIIGIFETLVAVTIDPGAEPHFERKQRPKPRAVAKSPPFVAAQQLRYEIRPHYAAVDKPIAEENLVSLGANFVVHELGNRNSKPDFVAVHAFARQPRLQSRFQKGLALTIPDFPVGRNTRNPRHQFMIKKRRTEFETMRHSRYIDLDQ